jgi:FdhD protein
MAVSSVSEVKIIKINSLESTEKANENDLLAVEEPLEIRLVYGPNQDRKTKSISITMRTPGNDFELADGFLYTEGIIKNHTDILNISYFNSLLNPENIVIVELKEDVQLDLIKLERHFYTTSSCGVCGKASIDAVKTTGDIHKTSSDENVKVSKELIYSLPDILRKNQNVFESTGGLHASALFDLGGKLLITREDVGRHNALDKLIGVALTQNLLPLDKYILLLSGRASFELIQKAAMANIKIVAAVGAPSSLAVQMANEFGITLIGFLRDNRFNIYSGEERIFR